MVDSEDSDARVLALFELLRKKDVKKIKKCGESIIEAVDDDAPSFEPEQVVQLLDIWMDACAAGVDGEVMDITAQVLMNAECDRGDYPGIESIFEKVPKALDKQTPEYVEPMTGALFASIVLSRKEVWPAFGKMLKHPKCHLIKTGLECMTAHYQFAEWDDDDAAACLAMVMDVSRHLAKELASHKPGDMEKAPGLGVQAMCLKNMLNSAHVFLMMPTVSTFPQACSAIAAPAVILQLQESLKKLKPKSKEEDLKEYAPELLEACGQLLSNMPTAEVGGKTSGNPVDEATAFLESAAGATDVDSLQGLLNMMAATTDPQAIDKLLARESFASVLAVFTKLKKGPFDSVWKAFQQYLIWAIENRPASTDAAAGDIAKVYVQGPVAMMQPKSFVDAATMDSPVLAKALWSNFPAWKKSVGSTKGNDMYPVNVMVLVQALSSLPRVLDSSDLSKFCTEMKQFSTDNASTNCADPITISALGAMKTVVGKDKTQVPQDVLMWVKQLQTGVGQSRDAANDFMDAYEGRSLAGAYEQIQELNAKFKEACGSIEGLKAYVDENVDQLKDFIGSVVKKLPVPVEFSSERRYVLKQAMLLHFRCQASPQTTVCALPEGTFTTVTYEWNRWLKLGLSAAKVGKSVLTMDAIGDVPGVVDQVKGMYQTYTSKDDADFLTFVSEPFLTSEEQDKLLKQLKKGGFFDRFCYDNQTATWVCANCHAVMQLAGPRATALQLQEASSHPDLVLPMSPGCMPGEEETLQAQVTHAAEAAKEAKNTGMACCSLFDMFWFCASGNSE